MTGVAASSLLVDMAGWPGIVICVDGNDRVAASNGCLEKLTGEAVVGRPVGDLLDDESSRSKWNRLTDAARGPGAKPWELILRSRTTLLDPRAFTATRADDGMLWLVEHPRDPRLAALSGEVEQMNAELATTQRALFKERARLASALSEVQRSNAALDEFAHVVSHDLKAPLRAIIDYSDVLAGIADKVDEEHRGYVGRLGALSRKMRGMIDAVLQYARAGRIEGVAERLDSGDVIRDVVEFIAPPADIRIELDGSLPSFTFQRVPFEQVLRNLLSNAVKYRRETGAVIRVCASDDGTAWRFVVEDNGPGVPAAQQQRIWNLFQTTRPDDSTGIGLAVVKRIVEAQGGDVAVESEPGAFARFIVRWPKPSARFTQGN